MTVFLYDGSFEGFLSAVYEAYHGSTKPDRIVCADETTANLLETYRQIPADPVKADKVARAVRSRISEDSYILAFHAFLSCDADRAIMIYKYLRLGFILGQAVDCHLQEACVFAVQDMSRRVIREEHRLTGLLRFIQVRPELYYAAVTPDHNIISLLAAHFADRMADVDWIIHDTGRDTAAVYNRKEWVVLAGMPPLPALSDTRADCPALWRTYFQSVAIAERRNPRLQRGLMPARYWKNLTEMND
jgi:probable DNA metabolism protein